MLARFSSLTLAYGLVSLASTVVSAPTATIPSGVVVGTTTSIPLSTESVHQFLGIPYAKAPERFAPAEPAGPFLRPYQANQWPPACIQQSLLDPGSQTPYFSSYNDDQSEDCLYLNIFAPSNATLGSKLPVLFWIHGGNLQTGSSSLAPYSGASMAGNQNVLVVSINYRLGAFGFAPSSELPATKRNLGFLDQRLALTWVYDNIEAFGGDRSKITIFGQSAGGYSVKNLWALPPQPLNFRAAIMESQGALLVGRGWEALEQGTGCGRASSPLACLRSKPATEIQEVSVNLTLAFPPTIDGVSHVDHIERSINSRSAAMVPIMIGTNDDETAAFLPNANLTSLTTVLQGFSNLNSAFKLAIDQILDDTSKTLDETARAARAFLNQAFYTCPASRLAVMSAANGYSSFRYYYNATFPNIQNYANEGAYHSSEIFEVFGTYPQQAATTQQVELSRYMQAAWADFAKHPEVGPGWPAVASTTKYVMDLGEGGSSNGTLVRPATVDTQCAALRPLLWGLGL